MHIKVQEHVNLKYITFNQGEINPEEFFSIMTNWLHLYTIEDNMVIVFDCSYVKFSNIPTKLLQNMFLFMLKNNKNIGKKIVACAVISSNELISKFKILYGLLYKPSYPNCVTSNKKDAIEFLNNELQKKYINCCVLTY